MPTPTVLTAAAPVLPAADRTKPAWNGSPHPARSPGRARRRLVNLAAVGGFLALAAGVAAYLYARTPAQQRTDLLFHTVRKEPMRLTVVERGALESADNRDVICRVKAGNKASNLTIKWVIEDGALVKQGQLLVEIEDTALQDQLKTQRIALDTARGNMIAAEEDYKIAVSQATSELATNEVNLKLAEIDLEKYRKGDYLQSKKDIENRIKLAAADVEQQSDRVGYTERMVRMKYLSPAQLQAEQSKLDGYKVNLAKVEEELRVLDNFTKLRSETDFQNKVDEAGRALERVRIQNKAKLLQAETKVATTRSIFEQEEDKYRDIEEQIANCRIYSPQDGLVVYYVSEQSRWGSGSSQSIVAQGEPVKEGQRLMRIPDLRRMVVNAKVHEAMVSRVHGEQSRPTGFSDLLRTGLLANPDPLSRVVSQHAVTDLKDRLHEYDFEKIQDGQKARVRIDAFSERILPGHVKSVATVASQQDWMSADVKVYQTLVAIDESVDGLKPGMSAEVTIDIDATDEPVLAVPLQAVIGGAEMGPKRKIYVRTPGGAEERDIVIGLSNEKMAEVRTGLSEGDEVVLNPKALVGDRAKVRTPGDAERPDGGLGGDGKGKGKGRGKNGMKGGFPKDDAFPDKNGYPGKGAGPVAGEKAPGNSAG